jgi:hypothetical protein
MLNPKQRRHKIFRRHFREVLFFQVLHFKQEERHPRQIPHRGWASGLLWRKGSCALRHAFRFMLRRVFRFMSLHAFRRARFRYWYIGRFSGKFPAERKKDSFCADLPKWNDC